MMSNTVVSGSFKKRRNLITFILCILGVALNMLCNLFVTSFELPLYLDTIGTIVVSVLGGYLPGVIVGFLTNLVKAVPDPSSLYYGSLNVLIAVFAAFFADRGWHKKLAGIIGMIFTFTLIGGGVGACIPLFMEGLTFDSESLAATIYNTGYFNQSVSYILSSLISDFPDKLITVILALMIFRLIPVKYYDLFSFKGWMQTPLKSPRQSYLKQNKVRAISLRTKILLVLGSSILIISIVAMIIGMSVYTKAVINDHARIAQGTATLAASVLDGDHINKYLAEKGTSEEYAKTEKLLESILKSSTDIAYLYVYQIKEDGCHVVFDIDTPETKGEECGAVIEFDQGFSDYLPSLFAGEEIEPIITDDKYGKLLTAYHPVYDSAGNCVCYAGADVDMFKLVSMERSFYVELLTVFLVYFFLICAFAIWLADYQLIIPVNSIMKCMDKITKTTDTQENMDDDVKLFRSLGIHTGDEIENLYIAACKMTKNQSEQMRNIRRLSDSTAQMQDGLITTMADLVESRDSDTGAHVQKTSAYVKIIVEGLQKKGYYPHKITPKFISDIVRSAPLHDIGKINIPDGILNKPGKLTEEEFEIMKTHTTAGKQIMENAISTVQGDNYLKEARNMAAYHHERWDGKGYPEGLHGEVIPLAARIMAVADVFDALTSPRIYKPAFPLDKALSIIEEGKGSQFDPKIVEVFMDSLDEVKVILRKYNQTV